MLRTSSTSTFGMIAQPVTDSTPHPADVIMEDIERRARPLITDAEARLVFGLARAMPGVNGVPELSGVTSWRRVLQLASDENAVIALRDALRHAARRVLPADVERPGPMRRSSWCGSRRSREAQNRSTEEGR